MFPSMRFHAADEQRWVVGDMRVGCGVDVSVVVCVVGLLRLVDGVVVLKSARCFASFDGRRHCLASLVVALEGSLLYHHDVSDRRRGNLVETLSWL